MNNLAHKMTNKLESVVRKAGRLLADHQVARIFKVPEEMSTTPCDFFGYTRTGRAILLECKYVHRRSLPVGTSNGLSPHQWNELCDAHRAGALALIAWARGDTVAVFDVEMARGFMEGRLSIPWVAIPEHLHRHLGDADYDVLRLLSRFLPIP